MRIHEPFGPFGLLRFLAEDSRRVHARRFPATAPGRSGDAYPVLQVEGDDERVLVRALCPGLLAETLEVTVEDDLLTLAGSLPSATAEETSRTYRRERGAGDFRRSLRLPFRAEGAEVRAELARGVLTLDVPRAREDRPVRIPVRNAETSQEDRS